MMESLKGIARRATQSVREKLFTVDTTPPDRDVVEVARKVRVMEAKSVSICEKIVRAARLMEELGVTLKELGEEYQRVPDLALESKQLAEDIQGVGAKLVEASQEHQNGLKDNGFDILHHFARECAKMKEIEEAERHHQLEYDFFKRKVSLLRHSAQKDFTRVPRNEQIMENWRVELWRTSENYKALLSKLYVDGRRSVDRSVLTTLQVLNSFVHIAATGFNQTFYNARLPEYPSEPVLPPAPLPPNPMQPQNQLAITDRPNSEAARGSRSNSVSDNASAYGLLPGHSAPGGQGWSQPPSWASPSQPPPPPPASLTAYPPATATPVSATGPAVPHSTTYQPPSAGSIAAPVASLPPNTAYQPPYV